jgi:bacteriocin-like protein
MKEDEILELTAEELDQVSGGILGFMAAYLIGKSGYGMYNPTGNMYVDAVVAGNMGA